MSDGGRRQRADRVAIVLVTLCVVLTPMQAGVQVTDGAQAAVAPADANPPGASGAAPERGLAAGSPAGATGGATGAETRRGPDPARVQPAVGSTNNSTQSKLRNESESVVVNTTGRYALFYGKLLNASWWDAKGDQHVEDATEINVKKKLFEKGVETSVKYVAGSAAAPAFAFFTFQEMTVRALQMIRGVHAVTVSDQIQLPSNYGALRTNLRQLRENTRKIDRAENTSRKTDLFRTRRALLKQTYQYLDTYLQELYQGISRNPAYEEALIPGTDRELGTTGYTSVRTHVENLRLLLVLDYYMTTSWVSNESRSTHIANSFAEPVSMPAHTFHYSKKTAKYYDTLDTTNDYAVYRVSVDPDEAGPERSLKLRLVAASAKNFSAYVSREMPDPTNPTGTQFTGTSDKTLTVDGVTAGDYYVLVKADNKSLPYTLLSSVYDPDGFLHVLPWNRTAPTTRIVEKGFLSVTERELPDEPDPDIECTCVAPTEEGYYVTVEVTNDGAEADWQSVAVSLPNVTDASRVEIVAHDMDDAYKVAPGDSVGAEYGTATRDASYLLVEGYVENWSSGDTHRLKLYVSAPNASGTQEVYAKSVAQADGVWYAAPAIGSTPTVDQQYEYVNRTTTTLGAESTAGWDSPRADRRQSNFNERATGPTHNLTRKWSKTLDAELAGAPVVTGETVYATTTNGTVYAVDRDTRSVEWARTVADSLSTAPTYENGALYVTTSSTLYGLDASTGSTLCTYDHGATWVNSPVVAGDLVYVTGTVEESYGNDGVVYAVDAGSGTLEWQQRWEDFHIKSAPAVGGTKVVVPLSDSNNNAGKLVALDRLSGTNRWTAGTSGDVLGSPAVGDGRVYASDARGFVHAVALSDGSSAWRFSTGAAAMTGPAVAGESVYVAGDDRLFALDAATGSTRWSYRANETISTIPAVTDRMVYAASKRGQRVYGLDRSDGSERWSFYSQQVLSPPAVVDRHVVFGAASDLTVLVGDAGAPVARASTTPAAPSVGESVTLNASASVDPDGTIQSYEWDVDGDGEFERSGGTVTVEYDGGGRQFVTVRVTDGSGRTDTTTVAVVVDDPALGDWAGRYADRPSTGARPAVDGPTANLGETWRTTVGTAWKTPTVVDGVAYVGSTDGRLYAVDQQSGEVRWTFAPGGDVYPPTVANGTVVVASSNNVVYALDAATGERQWAYDTGDDWLAQAVVDDGTVYVPTVIDTNYGNDGVLYAIDATTGALEWRSEYNDWTSGFPVAIDGDHLLVTMRSSTDNDGRVMAVDRETGATVWTTGLASNGRGAPTVAGDNVFVTDRSGTVYSLSGTDGTVQWTYATGVSKPASLAAAKGSVYLVGGDRVVALASATGDWQWAYRANHSLTTAPAVTARTVFVGSENGQRLYALDSADGSERWTEYVGTVRSGLAAGNGTILVGVQDSLVRFDGATGAPRARATVSDDRPTTGESVTLDGSDSTDPDGTVDTYRWDVDGDGDYEETGTTVTVSFETAGTRQVTLQVVAGDGVADTTTVGVAVTGSSLGDWRGLRGNRQMTNARPTIDGPTTAPTETWRTTVGTAWKTPTVVDGVAYVGSTDGRLYAVDAATGTVRWTADLGGDVYPPTVADDTVVAASSNNVVYALDATTGELKWQYDTGDASIAQPVVADGTVYVPTVVSSNYGNDGVLYAIDAATGERRWSSSYNDWVATAPVAVDGDRLLLTMRSSTDNDGRVMAVDRKTGTTAWTTGLRANARGSPSVADGDVFVADADGTVYALAGTDGGVRWTYATGVGTTKSVAVANGSVYLVGGDRVVALASATGDWQWAYRANHSLTTAPTVTARTVFVGSEQGKRLYALDSADGSERWTEYVGTVRSGLAAGNGTVLVGVQDSLVRFDGATGAPRARATVSDATPETGESVTLDASDSTDPDGTVDTYRWDVDGDGDYEETGTTVTYSFGDAGVQQVVLQVVDGDGLTDTTTVGVTVAVDQGRPWGTLRGDDGMTGATPSTSGPTHDVTNAWETTVGTVWRTPTVVDGSVYVGSKDGRLYAVDQQSGEVRWTADLGGDAYPPTVAGDTVYAASTNNVVYAFDAASGELKWQYDTGDASIAQPVVADGTVYVPTVVSSRYGNDGVLYAIDATTGERRWSSSYNDWVATAPVAVDGDRLLLTMRSSTGNDGRVLAVDRETGSTVWTSGLGANGVGTPAVGDGTVYAADSGGTVYALAAGDGNRSWSVDAGTGTAHSVAVVDGTVYAATGDTVAAIADGSVEWTHSVDGGITGAPSVTNSTVLVTSDAGHRVYAVDRFTGDRRWAEYVGSPHSGVAVVGDAVYFGTRDDVVAYRGSTGQPTASFTVTPATPARNETVTLNGSSSLSVDGSIVGYEWDVDGDGAYERTGQRVDHAFRTTGNHTVRLRVTADNGVTSTATTVVDVPDERGPTADVAANDTIVAVGDTVRFDATDSTDNEAVTGYEWRVGDGSYTPGSAVLNRTFGEAGVYEVYVEVTDDAGNVDTEWVSVTVVDDFSENLSATRTVREPPEPNETTTVTTAIAVNESVDGLAYELDLPDGFTLVSQSTSPGGTFKSSENKWVWLEAAAGDTVTVNYTVRAPADADVGETYVPEGAVSASEQAPVNVTGDGIRIVTCTNDAVSGSDTRISLEEMQQAIYWWSNDEVVPNTGGNVMGLRKIQTLVNAWAEDGDATCTEG